MEEGYGPRKRLRATLESRIGPRHSLEADYQDPYDFDIPAASGRRSLASAVTMPVRETKSRDEAITELEAEVPSEVKTRNKRMFGMLLGTLSGFKREERGKRTAEKKQKEVQLKFDYVFLIY